MAWPCLVTGTTAAIRWQSARASQRQHTQRVTSKELPRCKQILNNNSSRHSIHSTLDLVHVLVRWFIASQSVHSRHFALTSLYRIRAETVTLDYKLTDSEIYSHTSLKRRKIWLSHNAVESCSQDLCLRFSHMRMRDWTIKIECLCHMIQTQ